MPDHVRGEIENWIAWSWDGEDPAPGQPARCYSAEGRYLAPATDDEEREPRRVICYERAERVQEVYDRMPLLTRRVLRYEYTQRSNYDQWEQGQEVASDGSIRRVWVCTGNTKRLKARVELKISRKQYREMVEEFKVAVREAFANEVRG